MGAASQVLIQVPTRETNKTRVDDRLRTIFVVRVEYVGVCLSVYVAGVS